MAANEFIKFFENSENIIRFDELFNKSYFASPIKQKINIESNQLIDDLKNNIIINLNLNSYFKEDCIFKKEDILPIYKLFVQKEISESIKARAIFLLHASKMTVPRDEFATFFKHVNSIDVKENEISTALYRFFPYIVNFVQSLPSNKSVKDVVSDVVYKLANSYPDLSQAVKISYFESDIDGLAGFAGIKQVYLSLNEFDHLFAKREYTDLEMKVKLLKLRAFCLITHEMTHSALRLAIKDFNASSPKLKSTESFNKTSIIEAGVIAEKLIFKIKVAWDKSIENKFQIDYCYKYMERFLNGQCDVSSFDLDTSKLVELKDVTAMAFSYERHERNGI